MVYTSHSLRMHSHFLSPGYIWRRFEKLGLHKRHIWGTIPETEMVQLSDFSRKMFLCRGWWLMQKFITGPNAGNWCLWHAQAQRRHQPYTPSPWLRNHHRIGSRKISRARVWGARWCLLDMAGAPHSRTPSNCGCLYTTCIRSRW